MTEAEFAAVIDINLTAAIRLTLALEPRYRDGAAVVNLSSRASLGNFGQANYSASKAGLVGFGRALAQRWAPRVRVNAVAPSLVDTPMTQAMPPDVLAKLVARIPAGPDRHPRRRRRHRRLPRLARRRLHHRPGDLRLRRPHRRSLSPPRGRRFGEVRASTPSRSPPSI